MFKYCPTALMEVLPTARQSKPPLRRLASYCCQMSGQQSSRSLHGWLVLCVYIFLCRPTHAITHQVCCVIKKVLCNNSQCLPALAGNANNNHLALKVYSLSLVCRPQREASAFQAIPSSASGCLPTCRFCALVHQITPLLARIS